jgi:hypothetical protein
MYPNHLSLSHLRSLLSSLGIKFLTDPDTRVPTSSLLTLLPLLFLACNWLSTFELVGNNGSNGLTIELGMSWANSIMEGSFFDALMLLSTSYEISHFTGWLAGDVLTRTAAKFLLPNFCRKIQSHKEFNTLFHESNLFNTAWLYRNEYF